MSDKSGIEWTDATWNVVTGCSVVSAGCKHCYAMKLAGMRLRHHPSRAGLTQDTSAGPVWNGKVRFNEEWLNQPLQWKRPRRIFVCAHGDLFHDAVPDDWIARIFGVMLACPWHTFQVLTKRPARMLKWFSENKPVHPKTGEPFYVDWPSMKYIWLGVSIEDQATGDERIPLLLRTPAAVRWISAEPLLGHVNLRLYLPYTTHGRGGPHREKGGLDWVVAGGESGPKARPTHPAWVRDLRDQCATAGVPFLFKQWGEWLPARLDGNPDCKVMELNASDHPIRVGKKAAGRYLDGKLHDDYPSA